MGNNPLEDPDLKAMRASMRPSGGSMRWGRILTAVLVVACLTFAFAFYLPLLRAHETHRRFEETAAPRRQAEVKVGVTS